MSQKCIVVAIGGNAITREFEDGNIYQQFTNTRRSLRGLIPIIQDGNRLVLVHGNGPQVGNAVIRVEASLNLAPRLPLGVTVADLQGGMGYMIEQCLRNLIFHYRLGKEVATLITQVVVDPHDPAFKSPTKFIGRSYSKEEAERIHEQRGLLFKEDAGRGWRRVVASPVPLEIIEQQIVQDLVDNDRIVIAGGGGGVPVFRDEHGYLEGMNAVIDKDLTASVLARDLHAEEMIILTSVEKVALNYRTPKQKWLEKVTLSELKSYYCNGEFPPGSMGPKIRSVIDFLEAGGRKVVITSIEKAEDAWRQKTGTVVHPD